YTYCARKYNEVGEYALDCQVKYKRFLEESRTALPEGERERFDRATKRYILQTNAVATREKIGLTPKEDIEAANKKAEEMIAASAVEGRTDKELAEDKCSEESACTESENDEMTEERRQAYRAEMSEKFNPGEQP